MTPTEKRKADMVSKILDRLNTRYMPGSGLRQQLEASLAKNLSLNTLDQLSCVVTLSDGERAPEADRSVNCYFCGKVFDERDAVAADDYNGNDGGSICEKCVDERASPGVSRRRGFHPAICPVCDSDETQGDGIASDEDVVDEHPTEAYETYACLRCESRWINRATLSFYETEVTHRATGGA